MTVALGPAHRVCVRFAADGQRKPRLDIRVLALGHGARLDLSNHLSWTFDVDEEGEPWIRLPAGPFRIRVEADLLVSTQADFAANRFLVLPPRGGSGLGDGAERVDIRMVPTADGPVERRNDVSAGPYRIFRMSRNS